MLPACQMKNTDITGNEKPASSVIEETGKEQPQTPVVEKEEVYKNPYDAILEENYNAIKTVAETGQFVEEKQGISENASYFGNEALSKIGYAFEDVNNDGVEELLIGMEEEFSTSKNTLYEVYTIKNSKPHLVLEGRSRNSYSLLENGNFYNRGSNGAIYSIFGEYKLADGELKAVDFYFSYDKESYDDIGFFHNTTGVYEKTEAEELEISDKEFWKIESEYEQKTKRVMFKPFADLKGENDEEDKKKPEKIDGTWECEMHALDMNLILQLELSADGIASYKVGEQGSEWLSENKGTWNREIEGVISFNLQDNEGEKLGGEYNWSLNDDKLLLKHIGGSPLVYGEDGKTFTFNKVQE